MTQEVTQLLELHKRNENALADLAWYADARREARKRSRALGVPLNRYLGVVAATSPMVQWRSKSGKWPNLDAADRAFRGEFRGLTSSRDRAMRIVAGERPTDVLGSRKTASFYRNLTGLDKDSVTIDTWMMRAMRQPRETPSSQADYDRLAEQVRTAARIAGITPHALQASVWSQIKREQGSPNAIAA